MSNTLNRPMFKRGPDGQMREAHFWGGLAGIPTMWRQAKFAAPKFSNIGYNWNKGMAKLGVPKVTRDGWKLSTGPREVKPVDYSGLNIGKSGPRNYSIIDEAYDARMLDWRKNLDSLMTKHGAKGLTFKMMPQEVKDHWARIPRMPTGRKRFEQAGYGIGVPMMHGWTAGYPDDPEANAAADGETAIEQPQEGTQGAGVDGAKSTYDGEGPTGGPIPETKSEIEKDPDNNQGFDYDGAEDSEYVSPDQGPAGGPIPELVDDAVTMDDSISKESILKYKQELKDIIGPEDKTTGSLLLMQLGLGMMAGKSNQPGFAGFAEILGKTGQQVLPMWMEHMANRRKEDKEISLAAYEMLREDRSAKRKRDEDLTDWVWKKEYENMMNPPGVMSNIMVKKVTDLGNGETDEKWELLKQTYSKSSEAMEIMNNPEKYPPSMFQIVPLNISDAGMIAGGLSDPKGKWTDSQRGENAQLATTLVKNIPQILDFLMNPQVGLHSGNFKTGYTGKVIKGLRFLTKETNQALDAIGIKSPMLGDMYKGMYGFLGSNSSAYITELSNTGGLAPAGNQMSDRHSTLGKNDIWYGESEVNGQMVEGEFATEQYVRNLTDNSLYDIEDQLTNMMGFLMARLKQPTGRLLADTIQSSIKEQAPLGGMKDPRQAANQMHHFVKRLYEAYVRHAKIGGMDIETEWQGSFGKMSIFDYENSYRSFVGQEGMGQPGIDFSLLGGQFQMNNTQSAPGNIYSGTNNVTLDGPVPFEDLINKWSGGEQSFGDQSYQGQ